MGIVIYIGAITEEVGNKSKSSSDEPPKFAYQYGSSFVLTIISFITSEMNGVFSVYLYIALHQLAYHKQAENQLQSEQQGLNHLGYLKQAENQLQFKLHVQAGVRTGTIFSGVNYLNNNSNGGGAGNNSSALGQLVSAVGNNYTYTYLYTGVVTA